jgi:AcrR family transcriptional regulator
MATPTRRDKSSARPGASVQPAAAALSKGDARRLQLLDAAARCFREHGFHGTSIAKLSEASGMSAGHIYHYFRNKEAIVAGIVERDLEQVLARAQTLRTASQSIGVIQACVSQVDAGIALRADRAPAALSLEILAEATRNAEIATLLEEADRRSRSSTLELLEALEPLKPLTAKEKAARVTVLYALFDGLIVRSLVDPTLNRAATSKVIQRVVRMLLQDEQTE